MIELSLNEIASAIGGKLSGDGDVVIKGICTDSRKYNEGELFIALRGENFDAHDFIPQLIGKCKAFITSKYFDGCNCIVVDDTLAAFGRLAAFWKRKIDPKITVGVTGSVGKTTTKELISSVLGKKYQTHSTSGNFNNHIGVPITLIRIEKGTEAVVCEMGMSAKGEISKLTKLVSPSIAVITNIGSSHIENLGSRENICRAKLEILEGMEKGSTVILDGDEPLFRTEWATELLKDKKVVFVGFGIKNDIYPLDIYKGNDYLSFDAIHKGGEMRIRVPALGDHFIKNTLFAIAVGIACGVSEDGIKSGISDYSPTGLRQKIYIKNGIRIIADCYNASPESMNASLKVLSEMEGKRKIAVLGDMLELGAISSEAHRKVGEICRENNIDMLFTYGKAAYNIMKGALDMGFDKASAHNSIDKEELTKDLNNMLKEGDIILFKASRKMKLEEIISACGLSE